MDRSAGKNKEPHGIVDDIYVILLLQEFDMGVVKSLTKRVYTETQQILVLLGKRLVLKVDLEK